MLFPPRLINDGEVVCSPQNLLGDSHQLQELQLLVIFDGEHIAALVHQVEVEGVDDVSMPLGRLLQIHLCPVNKCEYIHQKKLLRSHLSKIFVGSHFCA